MIFQVTFGFRLVVTPLDVAIVPYHANVVGLSQVGFVFTLCFELFRTIRLFAKVPNYPNPVRRLLVAFQYAFTRRLERA